MADTKVVNASDEAIELAEKEGIDINTIKGTGTKGTVTVPDVEKAIKASKEDETPDEPKTTPPAKPKADEPIVDTKAEMDKLRNEIREEVREEVKGEVKEMVAKEMKGVALTLKSAGLSPADKKRFKNYALETKKKLDKEPKVKMLIPKDERTKLKMIPFSINDYRVEVPVGVETEQPQTIYQMFLDMQKADGALTKTDLLIDPDDKETQHRLNV